MGVGYWECRDAACSDIRKSLKHSLLKNWCGRPVGEVRSATKEIREANAALVADRLAEHGMSDTFVSWYVFIHHHYDDNGVARVFDFSVIVND